jgi:hypothetical protein
MNNTKFVNEKQTKEERRLKYKLVKHFTKSANLARVARDWQPHNVKRLLVNLPRGKL